MAPPRKVTDSELMAAFQAAVAEGNADTIRAREHAGGTVRSALTVAAENVGLYRGTASRRLYAMLRAPSTPPPAGKEPAAGGASSLGVAPLSSRPKVRVKAGSDNAPFTMPELPSDLPPAEEVIERRRKEFRRVEAAHEARRLIDVAIKLDGPIGVSHWGDPHLDDSGTDIALVERHVRVCNRTEGMFAANVGDMQNNWIGRLGRLYGEQTTSAKEAWVLVEWLVRSVKFLFLIGGNHDLWSGAGDPLRWIMQSEPGVYEPNGARFNLKFPNGRAVRINSRHDFKGVSQWNPAHGPAKAAQMGWRDHILTCGHLHISGYQPVKDPATGLLSHCIRVASYKTYDRYAEERGLPDQNFSENVVTVIDPYAQDENRLVTVFLNMEEGADYLRFKRMQFAHGKNTKIAA